jgi:hypothetical protein
MEGGVREFFSYNRSARSEALATTSGGVPGAKQNAGIEVSGGAAGRSADSLAQARAAGTTSNATARVARVLRIL